MSQHIIKYQWTQRRQFVFHFTVNPKYFQHLNRYLSDLRVEGDTIVAVIMPSMLLTYRFTELDHEMPNLTDSRVR